ncbi:MAG: MBL fold metallo-hydrolase [Patescibacteria group bacterium]
MKSLRKYLPHILLIITIILVIGIFYSVYTRQSTNNNLLKVAFLDVGQGDAIYVEAPNGKQMLFDAGPGPLVLQKLAEVMPFGDRSIDMIVITNPDKDHIGGFIDVLENYDVDLVLEPGTKKDTLVYKNLEEEIINQNIKKEIARRGMIINLDTTKNIYFDVLFPDRDVSNFDVNDGSIVGKLVYGSQSYMLTGDSTKYTELLIKNNEDPLTLTASVLKLGHHGSRTSTSVLWLEQVRPELAIISAGKNNSYGHPHKDILDRLNSFNIPYLGTYQNGTIILKTDGVSIFQ